MTDFDQREISSPNEQWRIEGYQPLPTERPIERLDQWADPAASRLLGNSSPRRNLRRCKQIRRVQGQISRLIADFSADPSTAWERTCRVLLRSAADQLRFAMQSDPQCKDSPDRSEGNWLTM